jgi:hypothetical protein
MSHWIKQKDVSNTKMDKQITSSSNTPCTPQYINCRNCMDRSLSVARGIAIDFDIFTLPFFSILADVIFRDVMALKIV